MPLRFLAAAFATAFVATAAHADDRTVCATSSDPAAVIVACGKIIANEKEPADVRAIAHANRGYAHQRNKDYDTAIADYDVAVTLNPKLARAYFNRGVAYYRKSDAQHAMSNFSEAIRLDPKDPEPYVNRAILQFELKQYAPAIEDMDASIKLAPTMTMLYTYRGKMHLAAGNADRAIADFKQVVKLDPSDEEAKAMLRDLGAAQ